MKQDGVQYRFELAVKKLQDDLQYLADNDKVSEQFLNKRNQYINCLIDYYQHTQKHIETLEMALSHEEQNKITMLKDHAEEKEKLEAVCLIHGVTDIAEWMHKPLPLLVWYVTHFYEMGACLLPAKWGERFSVLPDYLKTHVKAAMSFAYQNWFLKRKEQIHQETLEIYAATQGNKKERRKSQETPSTRNQGLSGLQI